MDPSRCSWGVPLILQPDDKLNSSLHVSQCSISMEVPRNAHYLELGTQMLAWLIRPRSGFS